MQIWRVVDSDSDSDESDGDDARQPGGSGAAAVPPPAAASQGNARTPTQLPSPGLDCMQSCPLQTWNWSHNTCRDSDAQGISPLSLR